MSIHIIANFGHNMRKGKEKSLLVQAPTTDAAASISTLQRFKLVKMKRCLNVLGDILHVLYNNKQTNDTSSTRS